MVRANLTKELAVSAANKVGMFAEVAGVISDTGVNITAICAYATGDRAIFRIITTDNNKTRAALAKKGLKAEESEVVTVLLEDKVGQAKEIADKIKKAGINLDYLYGTTCGCANNESLMVICSKESAKVISAITA